MRKQAKTEQAGLITISITMPNGDRVEGQAIGSVDQCMFAKWAAAMLFSDEVVELPDLQATVRGLVEA